MADQKDIALGELAIESGYLIQAELDEALRVQKKIRDEMGMDQPLIQVLVNKKFLTLDQAQEVRHAAAIKSGEASIVAGYQIVTKLGEGGMGAVYKARKIESGQYVALKILPPSLATDELIKRFKREADITSKLNHEHIVGCVEFGRDPKRKCWFCALELIEGEDLGKLIERKDRLTEDEAIAITRQVASALQHAHDNGLVHRDVKPENIMVTPDGTAKLLDLGLARPASLEATRFTVSGMFVGSPYYASPEQAVGERELDIRSDIYSLGATLYHMVTGRPPFMGGAIPLILQKHVSEQIEWPAEVNPDLSNGLCEVISKMMAKDQADRYQTPDELIGHLDSLAGGEDVEVDEKALKTSSVKAPTLPRAARARMGRRLRKREELPGRDRAARRDRDSARARRREREPRRREAGKPGAGLPQPVKIAMGAGALGLMVVIGLVMFLGEGEKVTPEPVPPGAGRPTVDIRKVSPPGKSAADTLREADGYEKERPDDLAGIIARYQAVSRDFPGTRQAGEAEINLARVRAALTAREREPVVATSGGTLRADTGKVTPQVPPPGDSRPPIDTGKVSPPVSVDVAALFARFDSLTSKGDHAGARAHAEAEAAKPGNAPHADALRAAARVAKALAGRPAAIRRGAESLVGKEVRFKLKTGTVVSRTTGKIKEVTDDHLIVVATFMINRQKRERLQKVAWSALHPEQEDEFAENGGWKVEAVEKAVARAYAAFASGDVDTADSALREAGGYPLAEHLKARVAKAKVEAAYTAAMDRARARMKVRNWKGAVESLEETLGAKPDDAEAKKLLAEVERHMAPPPTLTLDLSQGVRMEFIYIKPGVFMMGGKEDPTYGLQGVEKPKHEVAITQGFYIGKYEVTQAQYEAVMGGNPSKWREPNRPVEQVTWHEATEFCRLATGRTRKQFRLPTEAEWEFACRAGSTGRYCFGSDETRLGNYAWYKNNSGGQTHPVGQKKPNPWGLYDVHGNVWEWVADWYAADYYANSPRENPTGPDTGHRRPLRGGSLHHYGSYCRSAIRDHHSPSYRHDSLGFRGVVSASAQGR